MVQSTLIEKYAGSVPFTRRTVYTLSAGGVFDETHLQADIMVLYYVS